VLVTLRMVPRPRACIPPALSAAYVANMKPLMLVPLMVMISEICRSGNALGAPMARPALLISTSMGPVVDTREVTALVRAA
jgi:hypothetical protein